MRTPHRPLEPFWTKVPLYVEPVDRGTVDAWGRVVGIYGN